MKVADGPDYFEGLVSGATKHQVSGSVDIVASTYQGSGEVILNIGDMGAFLSPRRALQLGRYLIKASKQAKKELR